MSRDNNDSAVAIGCFLLTMLMVIVFWLATFVSPAPAQAVAPKNPCGPSAAIAEMLLEKYGERPAFAGIADNNTPTLIFTNPKTGTFTITIRRPGGITCLMTGGNSWTLVEQPKEGTDI
jgi:hypothetical protein